MSKQTSINIDITGTLGQSYTLPTSGDTILGRASTDTLTNKTLTSSSNVLGGVAMQLGSDATGDVYYRSGGVLTRLPLGTSGRVLTVVSGLPAWADPNAIVTGGLTTTVTYDPPSLLNGETDTVSVTLTGCVVGDTAVISFDQALPVGMYFAVPQVTAADTVKVTLVNVSGSTQDVASGNLKVSTVGATIGLASGGTGASLTDPGAHRLWGWDDTDNSIKFFTIGSGLSYDHATHTLSSSGGGGGLGDPGANGVVVRTALNTTINRTITGTTNQITVTNGDGVSGNPTLATPQDINTGATPRFLALGLGGAAGAANTLKIFGGTSGSIIFAVPAVAGSNTITFPAGTTDFSATGGTSQVVKQTSSGGAFTVAQLAFSDISGTATSGQLPAATVYNNQGNTYTTGAQDFASATSLKVPTSAGAGPTASGLIAYDSTSNTLEYGENGTNRTLVNTARQIINGTGITGGGDLSADRTLSVVADTTNQRVAIQKGGSAIGTRPTINFIEGSNVTLTVADNGGSNRVDVTVASTGGGGGSPGGSGSEVQFRGGPSTFSAVTGSSVSSGQVTWADKETVTLDNATTNTVDTLYDLQHSSSGTVANGFGSRIRFGLESSTTTDQDANTIESYWVDKTHATRSSGLGLYAVGQGGSLAKIIDVQTEGTVFDKTTSALSTEIATFKLSGATKWLIRDSAILSQPQNTIIQDGLINLGGGVTNYTVSGTATQIKAFNDLEVTLGNGGSGTKELRLLLDNATTSASDILVNVKHSSTGTPAAGFGSKVRFALESSTTTDRDAAEIQANWVVATDASRESEIVFAAVGTPSFTPTTRNVMRLTYFDHNTGESGTRIGLYGGASETITLRTTNNILNVHGTSGGGVALLDLDAAEALRLQAVNRISIGSDVTTDVTVGQSSTNKNTLRFVASDNSGTTNQFPYHRITRNNTGTPAAGFGTGFIFGLKSSTTNDQDAAQIDTRWTDATHATRTADLVFSTVNNAAALAEAGRFTAVGDLAVTRFLKIGPLALNPVADVAMDDPGTFVVPATGYLNQRTQLTLTGDERATLQSNGRIAILEPTTPDTGTQSPGGGVTISRGDYLAQFKRLSLSGNARVTVAGTSEIIITTYEPSGRLVLDGFGGTR